LTPLKATFFVPVNPEPLVVTSVATRPLIELIALMRGTTLNFLLLDSVPDGWVTVTNPVEPSAGTTALM